MKLDFIIPFYNKDSETLSKCLRSIKTQALKEWSVILVKDGPSDVPDKVVSAVFEPGDRVKVLEIPHGGACAARNAGFAASEAPYVVFWDADCIIEPEVGKQWVTFLDKHPEYGFVYSGYRFLGDGAGAIASEGFDPWTLRVRNYISACFPVRRGLAKEWDTSLKSLQDWDFWLNVTKDGVKGKFIQGFAFATPPPTPDSISGQGCTDEAWLGRVDAVKKKHKLPERTACVASPMCREDGILLAKAIDADYQDFPEFKPHLYETIIKIGFSMDSERVGYEADTLKNPGVKTKYLFWTPDDISTIYYRVSLRAVQTYAKLLNGVCTKQFVEDKASRDMMIRAGFNVELGPLPLKAENVMPMPDKPKWVLDIDPAFDGLGAAVIRSLPDIECIPLQSGANIAECTGIVHFYLDGLLTSGIKRMLVSGRHVISNVQSPFCGFQKSSNPEKMLKPIVDAIRRKSSNKPLDEARNFWREMLLPEKLKEKIDARSGQLCNS